MRTIIRKGTRTQQTGRCLTWFLLVRTNQTIRTTTITVTGSNIWWKSRSKKIFPGLQTGFDVTEKTWTTHTFRPPLNTLNKEPIWWATIIMKALIFCRGTKDITWVQLQKIKGVGFFDLISVYFIFPFFLLIFITHLWISVLIHKICIYQDSDPFWMSSIFNQTLNFIYRSAIWWI